MAMRLFLVYALVELAVLVVLTSTIGLGWSLLLVLSSFVVGVVLAGAQARRQLARLRAGGTVAHSGHAVTDGALVALGTVLVVVPGLATTAVGLLLLLPVTRAAGRPLLTTLAARGAGRWAPLITVAGRRGDAADVIDGEVIDVTDDRPTVLHQIPD
jgi:UPF0716 protein FxsA